MIQAAAVQVALLVAHHHRRLVPTAEMDRLYLREEYAGLPPTTDSLSPPRGGPDLTAAARTSAVASPVTWTGTRRSASDVPR